MLFVSKFAKYRHLVEAGSQKQGFNADGHIVKIETGASFWADFATGGLDPHDAEVAVQAFTRINQNDPFGAKPVEGEGSIHPAEAAEDLSDSPGHVAYGVWQRISRFDTDDGRMCPKKWKEAAEEVLLESSDFGRDFIRLDLLTLVPPWPSYDEMDARDIVPFALVGKYPLDLVLRYERATLRRPEVGVPLKKALDEWNAQRAEEAALTVTG